MFLILKIFGTCRKVICRLGDILVIAIIFMGMIMNPAGPEVY
jgi:hypothetical protein